MLSDTVTGIEVSSLVDTGTIRRDRRGIPYIEAANEKDLYFAQGYATASDRLWQMDFLRRTARGELAEILGPNALEVDKLHRIYGLTQVAEKLLERASISTLTVLESYAAGVNAFVKKCGVEALPLPFRILRYQPGEWSAIDSVALGKLFAEKLSFTADADMLRALMSDLPLAKYATLLPEISPLDITPDGNDAHDENRPRAREQRKFNKLELSILTELLTATRRSRAATGGDGQVGSNSWVISGERSASRKPLLTSDPHLPPTSPSIWYITHLSTGDLRVCGVSVPGVPGVMLGHNERIAWGITNLCPDVQDLYIEHFDSHDPCSYLTPSGWHTAEVRKEEIPVRKSLDGSENEVVTLEVKVTRHGPIMIEKDSIGLALRWTALDTEIVDLDTFLAINRARNWDEFVIALSGYGGPPQNFTYADVDGHIGYHSAGQIPIRRTGDGRLPYDGATDDGEWLGYIPFEELPHAFDPPSGIIVMANQRIVSDDYQHHLTDNWRVPYRARRISNRLQTNRKLNVDDFLSIQGDTYTYPDAIFAAELVKLAAPLITSSEEWREMFEFVDGWDGDANMESTALPFVVEMRKSFRRRIFEAAIGTELASLFEWRNEGTFLDQLITERPKDWLPEEFASYESLLLACYRETIDQLSTQLGSDRKQWTWGRVAQVRFPHPLERIAGSRFSTSTFPQNTGGSMPTVNAGSRVSLRFIADLSDWDSTRLCLPLGQSDDPSSVHREDQLEEWRNVAPSVLPFTRDAIVEATQSMLILTPSATDF
jgi:penicillin G amidase